MRCVWALQGDRMAVDFCAQKNHLKVGRTLASELLVDAIHIISLLGTILWRPWNDMLLAFSKINFHYFSTSIKLKSFVDRYPLTGSVFKFKQKSTTWHYFLMFSITYLLEDDFVYFLNYLWGSVVLCESHLCFCLPNFSI